jgi:hypothetical protein
MKARNCLAGIVVAVAVAGGVTACVRTEYVFLNSSTSERSFVGLQLNFEQRAAAEAGSPGGDDRSLVGSWLIRGDANDSSARPTDSIGIKWSSQQGESFGLYSLPAADRPEGGWAERVARAAKPFVIQIASGKLTFDQTVASSTAPADAAAGRVVTFLADENYRRALGAVDQTKVAAADLLRAGLSGLGVEDLNRFADARLAYPLNDLIRLKAFGIEPAFIAAWREAGRRFTVEELIRAKSFHLKAETAAGWKKAGYAMSLDDLIRADSFHIAPEYGAQWKEAGCGFSLDELIRANSFHLEPSFAAVGKAAGYEWSLEDLIRVNSFHLSAGYIKGMADAGYRFSVDDLIRLNSFHITPDFAAQLHHPAMKNLSAEELVQLKQRGLDTALLRRIRGTATQPAAGS